MMYLPLPSSVVLAATLLSAPVVPQQATEVSAQAPAPYVVEYYTPLKAPLDRLEDVMQDQARYANSVRAGIQVGYSSYGSSLLIQAPAPQMQEVLKRVAEADERYTETAKLAAETHYVHRLKYLSSNTALTALGPFTSNGRARNPGDSNSFLRMTALQEPRAIILSGNARIVDDAKGLLAQLDAMPPQLMLTCYLVHPVEGESSPQLPASLVRDLSALVPTEGFEVMASGMLPSNGTEQIRLEVELEGDRGYLELIMDPGGYDEQHGMLSLSSVKFAMKLYSTNKNGAGKNVDRSFSTSTSLATDQFTVLGAVGADPVFLVVGLKQL